MKAALFLLASLAFAQEGLIRQALQFNPRNSLAHYQYGKVLLDQQNPLAAENEFKAALAGDLDPPDIAWWSHARLAEIYDRIGQPSSAAFERAQAEKFKTTLDDSAIEAMTPPRILEHPEPEYSPQAKLAGLEGFVRLDCEIAQDGSVRNAAVSESLGLGLDENAIDVLKKSRFAPATLDGKPVVHTTACEVEFHLPKKQSRWHLVGARFYTQPGMTPPEFEFVKYPLGTGLTMDALDEGKILGAMGRLGSAAIAFDIDEHGEPAHFSVDSSSDPLWAQQAINLVREWRFRPAEKDGMPVPVPCQLELVWGPRELPPESLRESRRFIYPPVH